MDESVCLVFIFNHRYDNNIPKLRKIYGERFSKIRFLMPFYNGCDPEVIPVFESSYQFQGFLIQSYEKLMEIGTDYYLFIGDDLILNPIFNEKNVIKYLHGSDKKAVVSELGILNDTGNFSWTHSRYSSRPFFQVATRWKQSLIEYDEAMERFATFFGREYPEKYEDSFFKPLPGENEEHYWADIEQFKKFNKGTFNIPYPMAWGYSDIFVLHKDVMHDIAYTCGIFSSMNLFVEIAIPTSLVLNLQKEEVFVLSEDSDNYNKTMWSLKEVEQFAEGVEYSYSKLIETWDSRCRYAHPVKLSKWDV